MANGNEATKTARQPAMKPSASKPPSGKPPVASQRGMVVQPGECMSVIAHKLGFKDYKTIYDHGDNAALKKKRSNPNQLMPGDRIIPPPKRDKPESKSTGQTHQWVVPIPTVSLKLVFLDTLHKPLKGRDCVVKIGSSPMMTLKTNPQGMLDVKLTSKEIAAIQGEVVISLEEPRAAVSAPAAAPSANTPPPYPVPIKPTEFKEKTEDSNYIGQIQDDHKLKWKLQIGSMPPHEEPSGLIERLRNLGFDCGSETFIGEKTKKAVTRFLKIYYPNDPIKEISEVSETVIKDVQNRLKDKHDNP